MKSVILKSIIVIFLLTSIISIAPLYSSINLLNNNFEYEYHTYSQMTEILQNLQIENSDIMKLESYGKTYQNRDIWFVKISDNVQVNENEPGVLLLGAHHGDEKISYEIILFFIEYLLDNYNKENTDNDQDGLINEDPIDRLDNDQDGEIDEDPSEDRVREAIDNTQIFFIPMINPDGVEADQRKNCNPDPEHGVNINRNFGYDWKFYNIFPSIYHNEWASRETSGNYRGPSPYSETETQAIKRVAESFTINLSLSYHSGAEVVFFPWYHITSRTPHEELFIEIGHEMEEISGYPLWEGTTTIFPLPGGNLGTSENYLYGEHNILAYTVESHRQKSPTNPYSVNNTCFKNVGVHLYLCEKAQTVDNEDAILLKNQLDIFTKIYFKL
jgi:hypothetical protein